LDAHLQGVLICCVDIEFIHCSCIKPILRSDRALSAVTICGPSSVCYCGF
jgi:hypothetical protein